MARGVKCKCCGKALQPEEKHKYDNRYYCKECFHKVEKDAYYTLGGKIKSYRKVCLR